jgi:hypothetical protein
VLEVQRRLRDLRVLLEEIMRTAEAVRSALAKRWDARVHKALFNCGLWLEFRAERVRAELMVCRETADIPEWSEIHLALPAPQSLRVAPEEFTTWMRRLFGADDMNLGDAPFDKAFWIEASNPEWARLILDDDIRSRLLALRSSGRRQNRICIDVNSTGVRARVFRYWGEDEAGLNTLIETGLAVLRRARGPAPALPVELGLLHTKQGGTCPICSSPVSHKLVCPGCRTPHHAECWKYSGGCGIFACPGRARRAKRR